MNSGTKSLKFKISGQPDYAYLEISLPPGEVLRVEASSMATMDTHVVMKTKMKGGLGRLLTGENLFINEFSPQHANGTIGIAPAVPGDIMHQHLLDNESFFLRNSAFVAASKSLQVTVKSDLVKGLFSGAGLILVQCQGPGDVWFNSYGAAIEIEIDGEYIVDTDTVIAWTSGLNYKITPLGGYKSFFFSGEGLVCRFQGRGKVWLQSRSPRALTRWARLFRPGSR